MEDEGSDREEREDNEALESLLAGPMRQARANREQRIVTLLTPDQLISSQTSLN